MFRMMTGMSKEDFFSVPLEARGIPAAKPIIDASDDDGNDEDETVGVQSQTDDPAPWRRTEVARDKARSCGFWADGAPVGRGHGQPYLKRKYADAILLGKKTGEGRINEGVHYSNSCPGL